MLRFDDLDRAVMTTYFDFVWLDELRLATNEPHHAAVGGGLREAFELAIEKTTPLRNGEVHGLADGRVADVEPTDGSVATVREARCGVVIGEVPHRLGGEGTVVNACSSNAIALDQHDAFAEIMGTHRCGITSRACSEDTQIGDRRGRHAAQDIRVLICLPAMENASFILSRVLPQAAIDDTIIDAIVLSACADGMSKEELEALAKMARELPSLAGEPDEAVTDRIRQSFERVERDGLEGRLKQLDVALMDETTRRTIFMAAAVIQYADGQVTTEENEFMLDLADVLGLEEHAVREVREEIERNLPATK